MERIEAKIYAGDGADLPEEHGSSPGSDILTALSECAHIIQECLEEGTWEKATVEVANRGRLLQELSQVLKNLDPETENSSDLSERRRIRWMLEDILTGNETFIETLSQRISSIQDEIRDVKRGRKALGLYKRPHTEHPRFLNRIG